MRASLIAVQGSPSPHLDPRTVVADAEHVRTSAGERHDAGATSKGGQMRNDDVPFNGIPRGADFADETSPDVRAGAIVVDAGEPGGDAAHRRLRHGAVRQRRIHGRGQRPTSAGVVDQQVVGWSCLPTSENPTIAIDRQASRACSTAIDRQDHVIRHPLHVTSSTSDRANCSAGAACRENYVRPRKNTRQGGPLLRVPLDWPHAHQ